MLAYHWKRKAEQGDPKESFSCLVKIRYSKTSRKTIAAYSLIVISLNMASGFLSFLTNPIDINAISIFLQIILIIGLFGLGVWLVKEKK